MKFKSNGLFILCASLILGVIDYFRIESISDVGSLINWNLQMSILIFVNLVVIIFLMINAGIPAFSFTTAFILIATSFNCGQCLVNYLGLAILKHGDVYTLFGADIYYKVITYGFFGIYFTFLGSLCNQLQARKKHKISIRFNIHLFPKIENELLTYQKNITIILFIISLPAQLYITYKQIANNISYGYNKAALMTINPAFFYASKLLISAVILALYQLKNKGFVLYIAYLGLNLVTMVGGGVRSSAFLGIVVVTYVYFRTILKRNFHIRDIIILGGLGVLALHILVAIREVRAYGFSTSQFISAFFTNQNGVIGSYFSETTVTHGVLGYVISNENNLNQPMLGQFILGILGIIPGISKIFPFDLKQFDMQKILNISYMGGSYIADFYFDHVLILGSFLWGIFINKIFMYFEIEKNILKCAFWSPIVTQILFSVRTTTAQLPRMIVWMGIVFYLIVLVFKTGRLHYITPQFINETIDVNQKKR